MLINDSILSVKDLAFKFPIKHSFWKKKNFLKILDGVSFEIKQGESLGLVGESGCGKSTLARTLVFLNSSWRGDISYFGKLIEEKDKDSIKKVRSHVQIIFQDPYSSLNPRLSIFDILNEPFLTHTKKTKAERKKEIIKLLDRVGLESKSVDRYPHEFSGGQRQRICIARAIALKPKLIIADEPVSSLDVSIQAQILNLINSLREERNISFLFISHDLAVVQHVCNNICVLYNGKIVEEADAIKIYQNPKHSYTKNILASQPYGFKNEILNI